jgi:hypothetical protein
VSGKVKLLVPGGRVMPDGQVSRSVSSFFVVPQNAVAPGTTGQFTLTAVAPGSYKIFAWENIPSGAEENAEFMEKYESRGKLVTVGAGATIANLTVALISDDLN